MTKYAYIYQGLDAFTHLLRVASGLVWTIKTGIQQLLTTVYLEII